MKEIESLFQNKDLEKLIEKVPQLIEYQIFYDKVKYLKNFQDIELQEQFLYEIYEPTLKIAGTSSRAFKDFSKENYDTFSRLKWKWLANAIANQPQVEDLKNDYPRHEAQHTTPIAH